MDQRLHRMQKGLISCLRLLTFRFKLPDHMSRKESFPYRKGGREEDETNPGGGSQAVRELLQP